MGGGLHVHEAAVEGMGLMGGGLHVHMHLKPPSLDGDRTNLTASHLLCLIILKSYPFLIRQEM